jgi:Raf kinase inhibitor-like YbhB/YbcL family protein
MGSNICFKNGQTHNTGDVSPTLMWSGAPAGTMSYAISLHDTANGNTHWIMWDIPADVTSLPMKLPKGAMPGAPAPTGSKQRGASFAGGTTNPGYFGPGADFREYQFTLWAMKTSTLTVGATTPVNTMFSTTLPMNSIDHVTLPVCGDIDANCTGTCDYGGK